MTPIHKLVKLILHIILYLSVIVGTGAIFENTFTGDVSPFASPVVKLHLPTAKHANNRSKAELELKLYSLIRREKDTLKGFQRIASILDSRVTDLTKRTRYIQEKQHNKSNQ